MRRFGKKILILLFFTTNLQAGISYRIDSSLIPATINEFSNCRTVVNNSGFSIFIPTNTQTEWNLFVSHPPPSTTLGSCIPDINCLGSWGTCSQICGDGVQSYSITTPASGSGAACIATNGATQACNNNCPPVNGTCNNGVPLGCFGGGGYFNAVGSQSCGSTSTWQCRGVNGGLDSGTCTFQDQGVIVKYCSVMTSPVPPFTGNGWYGYQIIWHGPDLINGELKCSQSIYGGTTPATYGAYLGSNLSAPYENCQY